MHSSSSAAAAPAAAAEIFLLLQGSGGNGGLLSSPVQRRRRQQRRQWRFSFSSSAAAAAAVPAFLLLQQTPFAIWVCFKQCYLHRCRTQTRREVTSDGEASSMHMRQKIGDDGDLMWSTATTQSTPVFFFSLGNGSSFALSLSPRIGGSSAGPSDGIFSHQCSSSVAEYSDSSSSEVHLQRAPQTAPLTCGHWRRYESAATFFLNPPTMQTMALCLLCSIIFSGNCKDWHSGGDDSSFFAADGGL